MSDETPPRAVLPDDAATSNCPKKDEQEILPITEEEFRKFVIKKLNAIWEEIQVSKRTRNWSKKPISPEVYETTEKILNEMITTRASDGRPWLTYSDFNANSFLNKWFPTSVQWSRLIKKIEKNSVLRIQFHWFRLTDSPKSAYYLTIIPPNKDTDQWERELKNKIMQRRKPFLRYQGGSP